ncbi:NifB/NifX family molybdenum-iron cluster-binding protein [Geomesophilobacter sediminis]|uniref:Dinitrogenase iron-molybdenum cofactor biosynthesis domain-containing protein n=1 Tax=Geomesophilobacter sediminis TaxID=2798584 RepID=A0A8J7SDV0_9BACT|nr:NifB/NifX family molybdenum-iron cluster-binding protein [Geomesophilobacter sediminis]MBJ6727994.1 hypothetical protein [Geomesophilobacter sediminis]
MELKVALASSDGIRVDEHFGRASRFVVYHFGEDGWQFLEERKTEAACAGQEHSDDLLDRAVALLSDCRAVVVTQIGPTAFDLLIARRVLPLMLNGTIVEALDVVKHSRHFNRK